LREAQDYGAEGQRIKAFAEDAPSIKPQQSLRFPIAEKESLEMDIMANFVA
jgi:hypothetical protein